MVKRNYIYEPKLRLIMTMSQEVEKNYCFVCGKETDNKKYCSRICMRQDRKKMDEIKFINKLKYGYDT